MVSTTSKPSPRKPSKEASVSDLKVQLDKFKQAARDLKADDNPERFRERVGELVKHKPVEKPE